MGELIRFHTADGHETVVEIATDEAERAGIVSVSRLGDGLADAATTLDAGLDRVRLFAQTALDRLTGLPQPPEEVTLEFGVRFNAKAGAVIAQTEGEGHLKVCMTWRREGPRTGGS